MQSDGWKGWWLTMSDAAALQRIIDGIGIAIKREHVDYDEHAADPRWNWYARLMAVREEMRAWKMGHDSGSEEFSDE